MDFIQTSNFNQNCQNQKSIFLKTIDFKVDNTKKSIVYSQALRFNKVCCNKGDPQSNCKLLLNTLTKRGYSNADITTQIKRSITILQSKILNKVKHQIKNFYYLMLLITALYLASKK